MKMREDRVILAIQRFVLIATMLLMVKVSLT